MLLSTYLRWVRLSIPLLNLSLFTSTLLNVILLISFETLLFFNSDFISSILAVEKIQFTLVKMSNEKNNLLNIVKFICKLDFKVSHKLENNWNYKCTLKYVLFKRNNVRLLIEWSHISSQFVLSNFHTWNYLIDNKIPPPFLQLYYLLGIWVVKESEGFKYDSYANALSFLQIFCIIQCYSFANQYD